MERESLLRLAGYVAIDERFIRIDGMVRGVEFCVDAVGHYAGGKGAIRLGGGRNCLAIHNLELRCGYRSARGQEQGSRQKNCEPVSQCSSPVEAEAVAEI